MLNTYKYLSEALEALSPSVLQKMKKDNIGQLDDHVIMMHHSVNNNTHMGLAVSLCSNSNHLISLIPPNCLKF